MIAPHYKISCSLAYILHHVSAHKILEKTSKDGWNKQTKSTLDGDLMAVNKQIAGISDESEVTMLWTMYCNWVNKPLVHLKSWWIFNFHVIFSWWPPFSGLNLFALLEGVWLILQMLLKLWSTSSPLAILTLAYTKSNLILWNKNVCKGRESRLLFGGVLTNSNYFISNLQIFWIIWF